MIPNGFKRFWTIPTIPTVPNELISNVKLTP